MKTPIIPFFLAVKRALLALGAAAVIVWTQGASADGIQFLKATSLFMPNANYNVGPSLSSDGLTLYFASSPSADLEHSDIWSATRGTRFGGFGPAISLGATINSSVNDGGPSVSPDGLSLFFSSNRPGGEGDLDLYVATRATTSEPFGTPVNLGAEVNSPFDELGPAISADGLTLFFWSDNRPGGFGEINIWMATRPNTSAPFGEVVNLGPTINSGVGAAHPSISADGLSLLYNEYSDFGSDLFVSTRTSLNDPWGDPENLGPNVNGAAYDHFGTIAWDGLSIVFASDRTGSDQIYEARTAGYAAWIAGFGLTGANAAPDADPDSDGLPNSVEYVVGANPTASSGALRPTATVVGGNLVFTFSRADASEFSDVTLAVQAGTDLATWPALYPIGPDTASSAGGVTVIEHGAAPDTITVTIPRGSDAIKFARLIVTVTQ